MTKEQEKRLGLPGLPGEIATAHQAVILLKALGIKHYISSVSDLDDPPPAREGTPGDVGSVDWVLY